MRGSLRNDDSRPRYLSVPARSANSASVGAAVRCGAEAGGIDEWTVLATDVVESTGAGADGLGRKPVSHGSDHVDGSVETAGTPGITVQ